MAQHFKMGEPIVMSPDEAVADQPHLSDYTVPIPEGLTEEFEPSQPCTREQLLDYACGGPEPYPGYAEEEQAWLDAWNDLDMRQAEADGDPWVVLPTVIPQPDFDEEGEPVHYEGEPEIMVDGKSREATLMVPQDEPEESAAKREAKPHVPTHNEDGVALDDDVNLAIKEWFKENGWDGDPEPDDQADPWPGTL